MNKNLLTHLRSHKRIENTYISGNIVSIEKLEARSVLINFYSDLKQRSDFLPAYQQYFGLKKFLQENFIEDLEQKNLGMKNSGVSGKFIFLLNKPVKIFLQNESLEFRTEIWKHNINQVYIAEFFKKYKKIFNNLEKAKKYYFLKTVKNFFINRSVNKYLDVFNYGKNISKNFYKRFLKDTILSAVKLQKKNVFFFLWLHFCNRKGLFFLIPGVKERFFLPYFYLKMTKKKNYKRSLNLRFSLKTQVPLIIKFKALVKKKKNGIILATKRYIAYRNRLLLIRKMRRLMNKLVFHAKFAKKNLQV